MTPEQWKAECSRLQGAVTRAKTTVKSAETLADKITAKAKVTRAEEALREHKLNYHALVTNDGPRFRHLEVVLIGESVELPD